MEIFEKLADQIEEKGQEGLLPQKMPDELLNKLTLDDPDDEVTQAFVFIVLVFSSKGMVKPGTPIDEVISDVKIKEQTIYERIEIISTAYSLERLKRKGLIEIHRYPNDIFTGTLDMEVNTNNPLAQALMNEVN